MFNFDILLQSNYQHPETFEDFLNIGYRTFNDRYFRNAYANKLMNDAYYQGFKQGSDIGPKGKEPLKIEPEEQDSTTEIIEETNIISPATYQDAINNSSPSDIVAKINKKTGQITYYKNYDNINETAQKYLKNNDLVKGVIDDYINLEKLPKSINKNTKISIYDFAKKETSTTKFDKFGDNFSKREKKIKFNEKKKMEKIIPPLPADKRVKQTFSTAQEKTVSEIFYDIRNSNLNFSESKIANLTTDIINENLEKYKFDKNISKYYVEKIIGSRKKLE